MQHLTPFLDIKCPSVHVYALSLLGWVRNSHLKNAHCSLCDKMQHSVSDAGAKSAPGPCCRAAHPFIPKNQMCFGFNCQSQ